MSRLPSKFTAIGLLAVLGLAACGGGYNNGSTPTNAPTTVAVTNSTAGGISTAAADVMLTDSTFGPIVSDGGGTTLYMYAPDSPDAATCTGGCSSTWPPFLFEGVPSIGEGLSGNLFTTVSGEGGSQLAYNGHPLYHFAGDSAPGDTNGQGSGGVWFILDADGNQITA